MMRVFKLLQQMLPVSSSQVCSMEAKELKNMRSGFKYFEDWCLDVSGGN